MANWLAAPLWPLEIFTATKAFSNPLLASEKLNRRGLYAWRVTATHRLADRRRRKLRHLVSDAEREAFDTTGAIVKTPLAPDAFAALREEVMNLSAPAYEMREGDAVTRRIAVTPSLLTSTPTLARLVASQEYQGPIRYAGSFDVAPQLYIQTIFTHVVEPDGSPDPQNQLHMDTFHPTVKSWLWLDDVDEDMGPFAYVFGSHKLDPRRLAWHKRRSVIAAQGGPHGGSFRVSDAELRRLHLPDPHVFVAPAGTMVAGDTFGLHRRTRATRPSRRVELWATSRPNPFNPFIKNWLWPLPGMEGREAILWQEYATFAHKMGLRKRKDWHYVGKVRPKDDPRHPSLT
ncbi:phytanoyl-CoA dioxygenase family protein [Acuticoccus sp. M5D2P5]|uniref:phytanoyl-CoA dioxygenase family protein n=1 Tax=Acuticoccus kalidii TaxID=2910977 RepID=UPI001F1E7D4C|nr:phytanoyl-CoA dioxygenase family protein [Acuticoccus kalidii]MCF3933575.1 phytanoyl-CoA dioxygenase family protein [Acuticoccus kalidii]